MDESELRSRRPLSPRMFIPPPSQAAPIRRSARGPRLCSRLERSPRQRAVQEGFVARSEGCPTVRIVLHLQVRAVHRIWQNKRPFQQAGLATPHRGCKTIGAVGHPSLGATRPSATVRAHRRARCRRPAAAAAGTQRYERARPPQGRRQVRYVQKEGSRLWPRLSGLAWRTARRSVRDSSPAARTCSCCSAAPAFG